MSTRPFRPALLALGALLLLPVIGVAQFRPTRTKLEPFAGPQALSAGWHSAGVQLSWQGAPGAARYLVLRGPAQASLAQIAELPGTEVGYLDQKFVGPAVYQVVAVSASGLKGPSAVVAYSPPAQIATLSPVGVAMSSRTMRTMGAAPSAAAPVVSSVVQQGTIINSARNGQTVTVNGSGLDGLTSVTVIASYYMGGTSTLPAGWYPSPGATQLPITPANMTPSSFTFVPQLPVPFNLTQSTPYVVTVTKGTTVHASSTPVHISATLPVRKITHVDKAVVRAGQRVTVHGLGFDNVTAGYFGPGVQGSTANPQLNIWNRSATGVQLETPANCSQEGILMLAQQAAPGESNLITGDTPIIVACTSTPTGLVVGTESSANGILYAMPGSKVTIRGTGLKYVTRVVDNSLNVYPHSYAKVGNTELLSVTLPTPPAETAVGFFLENPLTDPVLAGAATGTVVIMAAPNLVNAVPAWAEPGQLVQVYGQRLKYNSQPQVTVGGVPAQVVSAVNNSVSFRLAPTTTTGPIRVQTEAGSNSLTGTFITQTQVTHPGFFVVTGPSAVSQISSTGPLGAGSVLTVTGQNLARVGGLCVAVSLGGPVVWEQLRRPEHGGSATMGSIASNTSMQVTYPYPAGYALAQPVKLLLSAFPVGDTPPTQFVCTANPTVVNLP